MGPTISFIPTEAPTRPLIVNYCNYAFDSKTLRHWVARYFIDPWNVLEMFGPLSSWDTGAVTDMQRLFSYKRRFNDDISKWKTQRVTDMHEMFYQATHFNINLNKWNVRKVENFKEMFYNATSYGYHLNSWGLSLDNDLIRGVKTANKYTLITFFGSINTWDTSSVTDMEELFYYDDTFNANITNCDVSKVTTMRRMFQFASSFNRSLCSWLDYDNFPDYVDTYWMFYQSGCNVTYPV